jgi:DNA-binding NtrC family response regulator
MSSAFNTGGSILLIVPRRRNDETGQYEEAYSDEAVLDVLRGTRLSTREVANELGCHRTTAYERLSELEVEGKITSTEVGNTKIWELD